jgi:hypothetical protein
MTRSERRERQDAETKAFLETAYANPGVWFKVPLHLGVVPISAVNLAPDGSRVEITAALDLSVFDFYREGGLGEYGQVWARRKKRPFDLPPEGRD